MCGESFICSMIFFLNFLYLFVRNVFIVWGMKSFFFWMMGVVLLLGLFVVYVVLVGGFVGSDVGVYY